MQFFIDTAHPDQIQQAQYLGVLDGVTTNSSSGLCKDWSACDDKTLSLIASLLEHPLTESGLAKFLADHKRVAEQNI
ncbi:beta/alpha barrel domain-containing protein [Sphingobacterium corticibacterium]|uniref:hypothetical protein n=1 Tax=Sphingobacterium corticibacterium TaxID=2484746 RepID=UPI001EF01779|nr:hypothetical protein [Sphingobacterium corticibacterium]